MPPRHAKRFGDNHSVGEANGSVAIDHYVDGLEEVGTQADGSSSAHHLEAGGAASPPAAQQEGPLSAADTMSSALCLSPAPSILGPRPTVSAVTRRKKKVILNDFTPRQSARLGKKDNGTNKGPYHRAQTMLTWRMGFTTNDETVTEEMINQYVRLFNKPLAPQHICMVTALLAPEEVDFDEPAYAGFQAFALPEEIEPCA
jgi:hypothetical protein